MATPPVITIRTCGRTASSLAMFTALVTIVIAGWPSAGAIAALAEIARATSVAVVPPVSPTMLPRGSNAAVASPIRCFSDVWRDAL
jgi:hypothetical protein